MNIEISDYIKKLLAHKVLQLSTSEEDERALQDWIAQSNRHQELLDKMQQSAFVQKAILDDHKVAQEQTWQKIMNEVHFDERKNHKKGKWIALFSAVAAAVAIIFILTILKPGASNEIPPLVTGKPVATVVTPEGKKEQLTQKQHYKIPEATFARITVPNGGEFKVELADGTLINLYSGSTLIVPETFTAKNRQIHMRGEGYFEVAKDKESPFIITTNQTTVKVLGTVFNLRDYGNEEKAVVTLIEGKVEVSNEVSKVIMHPSMQIKASKTGAIVTNEVNNSTLRAVEQGDIVFTNATLDFIMNDIARIYDVDIQFDDAVLKDMKFTLSVNRQKNLRQFLNILSKVNKVSFTYQGNTIHVVKI